MFAYFLKNDKTRLVPLCLFLLAFGLSPRLLAQETPFTYMGVVLSKDSLKPVAGANITLVSASPATTNAKGFFSVVCEKAQDNVTISINAAGFLEYTGIISLHKASKIDTFYLDKNFTANVLNRTYYPPLTERENLTALGEIVLSASRVDDSTPLAFTNVGKKELAKQNLGQDLPILLNFTPSTVTTSDAGAGVGYTGIRIRGSDATRTNVTINGIPYNDPESQGTFWVNMPDFASSVSSIQIQRGVGTSTNGAGAFGATVNIQTNQRNELPYLEFNNSAGSFNTFKHTLMLGTGVLKGKFSVDARLSKISSDGFVDRGKSDLKSFYTSTAYYGKRSSLRLNIFSGTEKTYQAWNGVPESRLRDDAKGMQDYIDRNGLSDADAKHLLASNGRTYNSYTYANQTDNYQQDHYQLFYSYQFAPRWNGQAALHYTYGRGYYEEFRPQDKVKTYTTSPIVIGGESFTKMDVIRRRWLDNDFFGGIYSVDYKSDNIEVIFGGGWNKYLGRHFGEVIWAQFASSLPTGTRYYENQAEKQDMNLYAKAYSNFAEQWSGFLDVQWRSVFYDYQGLQIDALGSRPLQQNTTLSFFNPKAGVTFKPNNNLTVYTSLSVGNREPNREDFINSSNLRRPQAERMYDVEGGVRLRQMVGEGTWHVNANLYYMHYDNQLVLTGKVNDVGNYTRMNVSKSYRRGVEIESTLQPNAKFAWNLNLTLSDNKILNYVDYTDDYDTGNQQENTFSKTNIAFSPSLVAGSQLTYLPFKGFSVGLLSKYVGKQYLDNTSSEDRKLNAYMTQDVRLAYEWKVKGGAVNFNLLVNNILNAKYESNGYTYGYWAGGQRISENFYYPQAGTNFLFGLGVKF